MKMGRVYEIINDFSSSVILVWEAYGYEFSPIRLTLAVASNTKKIASDTAYCAVSRIRVIL